MVVLAASGSVVRAMRLVRDMCRPLFPKVPQQVALGQLHHLQFTAQCLAMEGSLTCVAALVLIRR